MKKNSSLFLALLLMTAGWVGAFLLSNNPVTNQGYWLLPAVTIGCGIGLCLRFISGRKTALLLAITVAGGLMVVNLLFPDSRISTSAIRGLLTGTSSQDRLRPLVVADRLQTSPFDQPLALVSPVSLDLSLYARFAAGVNDFCFSSNGTLFASLPDLGAVYRQQPVQGAAPPRIDLFVAKLDNPTGLVCDAERLLVAESSQIKAYRYVGSRTGRLLVDQLPDDGGHLDHRLQKVPQGLLYTIGSRCDACEEKHPLRATVQLLDQQGERQEYARGLRSPGGLTFNPDTDALWVSERSRLYPAPGAADELNQLSAGKNYGWPGCEGTISTASNRCNDSVPAALLLRNRANPAGLMTTNFLDYPLVYRSSLLLVLQGDADNRIVPAVVRIPLVESRAGDPVPFLGGWDGISMRPSAIHLGPDGAVYIADDISGAIYRAAWKRGG